MVISKSIVAVNTKKSLQPPSQQVQISPLRSALDAVVHLEIQPGTTSSEPSQETILASLLSMIVALQFNCLSNDMWILSMHSAKKMAVSMGVKDEEFVLISKRLEEWRAKIRAGNPFASMF